MQNCKVFHFSLLPAKSTKIWQNQDNSNHSGSFLPISEEVRNFWTIYFCLFSVSRFLLLCQISEKANWKIPKKNGYRHTNLRTGTQMDRQALICRTSPFWGLTHLQIITKFTTFDMN